jgi:hypothetical protein
MEFYQPRKIMFKAWNRETRLLMRLDSIQCVRGELLKKDHVLLQYTGQVDKQLEELYEMDLVLIGSRKHIIQWSLEKSAWCYLPSEGKGESQVLTPESSRSMIRLCSFFESQANA